MKVQATVLPGFQATSLAEAGALLDDVLRTRAGTRRVDVRPRQLLSPPGDRAVTLPPVSDRRECPRVPPPAARKQIGS
jgi:hypothetical protein